ncbi:FtsX-like permease family protein [Streptomyces beijiangensis]|uniref:ABC transporter permease n=1 Tax=Streptomyces beijiangensis TaxID=163361 RepID=A0A939FD14_9ACTN|nr:FtsX-like permease family protein [Streptomyces beijiangensis]MBO0515783.1 ABC transporter permease [Streptomyces beijiangensis]
MLTLALRTLRFRKGGFVATFVALFFGTAIVVACGGLLETGIRNNLPPERLAGATAVVVGDRDYELHPGNADDSEKVIAAEEVPLAAGIADKVRAVGGVEKAVPDVSVPARLLVRGGGEGGVGAQGHTWSTASLAPHGLSEGRAPVGDRQVVLDAGAARAAGLRVGDTVRIAAHGGSAPYEVSGILGGLREPALFFGDAEALRLAGGEEHVGALAVVARAGTGTGTGTDTHTDAELRGALAGTGAKLLTGDDRGFAEEPQAVVGKSDLVSLSAVFGGMAVMVALFVTASTMSLSAAQRQRETALMRAVGATPRQLRRMLLIETLIVAVGAALLAWLPGQWLGGALFERLADAGITSQYVQFSSGWIPLAAAGGAVLLTAVGAGLVAGHRAIKVRPTEALAEAAVQQRWFGWVRGVFAFLFLAGTAALSLVTWTVMDGPAAASTAGPTVICATIGLALLSPGLTKVCAFLLDRPVRAFTGTGGYLAMLNSRARTVAVAAAVTPIMLASGVATANLYLQTTQTAVSERAFTADLHADAVLTSASGTVSPGLADRVRALPGVAAAGAYVSSTGFIEKPGGRGSETGEDGLPLRGVSAEGAGLTSADTSRLRGNTTVLPRDAGHRAGEDVTLRLGDNSTALVRVAGTYDGEAALLPVALLAPHTTGGLPEQILVRGKSGADMGPALRQLAVQQPGLMVADRDALISANAEDTATQAWINYLMVGMIVAYTAIAVVNSLVTSVRGRRREFGLQRLTGATSAQILRMVVIEALVVAAIGILLGTVAAATTLVPFSHVAAGSLVPSGSVWIYGGVVGTAVVLALAASVVPAWRVLRGRPVVAALGAA